MDRYANTYVKRLGACSNRSCGQKWPRRDFILPTGCVCQSPKVNLPRGPHMRHRRCIIYALPPAGSPPFISPGLHCARPLQWAGGPDTLEHHACRKERFRRFGSKLLRAICAVLKAVPMRSACADSNSVRRGIGTPYHIQWSAAGSTPALLDTNES